MTLSDPRLRELRFWAPLAVSIVVAIGVTLKVMTTEFTTADSLALDWPRTIIPQTWTHLGISFGCSALAMIVGIPMGIWASRMTSQSGQTALSIIAGLGQSIPSYGVFILLFTVMGTGAVTATLGMAISVVLPIFRNTNIALREVPAATIDAARGIGMSPGEVLRQVELPLATPVILAGIRTAVVLAIATSTLTYLIGGGGLGETIMAGFSVQRPVVVMVGAGIITIMALLADWLLMLAAILLTPWETAKACP